MRFYLWIFIASLVFAGCLNRVVFRPLPKIRSVEILKTLKDQAQKKHNLTALISVHSTGIGELIHSGELDVVAQRPAQIYLALRSFFNQPMRITTFDGQKFYDLDLSDADKPRFHTFLPGKDQEEILSALGLTPSQAIEILFGSAPLLGEVNGIELSEDGAEYRVSIATGRKEEVVLRISADTTLLGFLLKTPDAVLEVSYGDFKPVGIFTFPFRCHVRVHRLGKEIQAVLKIKRLELNQKTLPFATFRIDPPL